MSAHGVSLILILFTVTTNAAAQIMLKQGMTLVGPVALDGSRNPVAIAFSVAMQPWIILGLATFVVSMASHMIVLSRVNLSFAYPFLSLAYVMVAAYSFFFFNEPMELIRLAGYALIISGTILIAFS